MLITKASEYAILSLIVLARSKTPIDSERLSQELSIPKSFLAKILQALAKNDILTSYKGANGGFALHHSPSEISMLQIMSAVEGKNPTVFECSPSIDSCPLDKAMCCTIWPFLHKLQGKIDLFLAELTLADVLE
ncbi:MAG: Rrf2 family transcriptional regulator [Sulfuricurvum sp.]|jgi:Rrf2 family protein